MGGQAGELALRLASKAATGGDAGERGKRGGKEEKEGEKGGLPLCRFGKKGEGSGGDAAERGGAWPPFLGGLRAEWRGPGGDDGDDVCPWVYLSISLSLFIFFLSFSVHVFLSLSRHTSPSGLIRRGDDFFSLRDEFVRSAHAALADAFLPCDPQDWERKHDVVAGVVSHPVARRVEELRVAAIKSADGPSSDKEVSEMEGEFHLSLSGSTQPSETLRVLDLTGCGSFSLSAGMVFPRLTTLRLRLRLCVVQVKDLQGVVDSAPALTTVHLESVFLAGPKEDGCASARPGSAPRRRASRERGKEKKRERERGRRVLGCRRALSPSE
uniref:OSJNBa0061C06.8 protein n=1 Tax=Oryza sativa subsp. japonica TaxID=39947 RepID=Q5JQU1_ORYSJ|nr:OSJNBa0061C06.8 [Oryza sativa Japonica Group]